jgi:hypothetical protein
MAYSINKDTKVATYNGDTYPPTQKTNAQTGETTLIAKSEAECIKIKKLKDNAPNEMLNALRSKRNSLLAQTDWMGTTDVTMSAEWKTYRQELRDITKTFNSISDKDFKFPTKPKE